MSTINQTTEVEEVLADLWSSRSNLGLTWNLEYIQESTDVEIPAATFAEFNEDILVGHRCRSCAQVQGHCGCDE